VEALSGRSVYCKGGSDWAATQPFLLPVREHAHTIQLSEYDVQKKSSDQCPIPPSVILRLPKTLGRTSFRSLSDSSKPPVAGESSPWRGRTADTTWRKSRWPPSVACASAFHDLPLTEHEDGKGSVPHNRLLVIIDRFADSVIDSAIYNSRSCLIQETPPYNSQISKQTSSPPASPPPSRLPSALTPIPFRCPLSSSRVRV